MARRGALVQQLNAVESLASVDIICLDKTGPLTDSSLRLLEIVPAPGAQPESALARFAASATARNDTIQAIADASSATPQDPEAVVPFSSRRRWSGLRLGGVDFVLGAPELFELGALADRADAGGAGRPPRRCLRDEPRSPRGDPCRPCSTRAELP